MYIWNAKPLPCLVPVGVSSAARCKSYCTLNCTPTFDIFQQLWAVMCPVSNLVFYTQSTIAVISEQSNLSRKMVFENVEVQNLYRIIVWTLLCTHGVGRLCGGGVFCTCGVVRLGGVGGGGYFAVHIVFLITGHVLLVTYQAWNKLCFRSHVLHCNATCSTVTATWTTCKVWSLNTRSVHGQIQCFSISVLNVHLLFS